MNLALLGGTGYLGRKLIPELLQLGHQVTCLKREHSNCSKLPCWDKNLRFCDVNDLEWLVRNNAMDCFINLAGKYMTPANSAADILRANLELPLDCLHHCIDGGVKKFITIGTGLPADYNLYTKTKSMFADYCEWLSQKNFLWNKTSICNMKLEYFYGPDEPEDRFIASTVHKLKLNLPVPLTKGEQKRDFIHIDDVVRMIIQVIARKDVPPYFDLPVGTGEAPTIREVVTYLHQSLNSKSELQFGQIVKKEKEPDSYADTRLIREFGFTISYSWKKGMDKVMQEQ